MKHEKPAIFINYRRALSTLEARLLYLMLELHFPGNAFMDEQTLEAGDRWREDIERTVKNARVMICLIPEGWVSYAGEKMIQSKLYFDPKCHVRHEIRTALEAGLTIIPVLVNGAKQPDKEHLPEEISELFDTFNNAAPLDFKENPDVAAFEKFFEQVGKKAALEQKEEGYGAVLFSKLLEEEFSLPPAMSQLLPEAESPFVGLRPFHREDARIFFGRSRETYHLCFKVAREDKHRIFLLDGYSGTGKSSLLQAGLIPRVEEQGWAVRYRRREEDPINGLKGVLGMLLEDVANAPEANRLLILDQVEEAITDRIEGLSNELEEMAQALQEAYLNNPGYKFILSFRSEQMARVTKVLDKLRLPYDKENTLHQLDFLGATEAISGAANDRALAAKYKLRFSPKTLPGDIAGRLLKGWDNYHIAPLVQVNMELLWEHCQQADGTVVITAHNLDNIIDRQDGLLGHFIRKVRETIPEAQADEQKVLQLLDQYVQDEPASAIRLDKELFAQEAFRQEKVFRGLHREFKKQYLLTEISMDGQKATRLSHDVLAKVIRERYQILTEAKLK
ncbi:MAG: toll/interleukin-1 receptor domain-containing protein, partial [Phaeodactylibacter sp.]|nr:toll/interleukin-1 receptor domain-containing protein [Phaeodactylibacter sp.]